MLRPDLSLIHAYRKMDAYMRPVTVTHFQKDRCNLYYVNAHHVTGIDNATCHTVREAIELYKPAFIIVEAQAEGKISPPSLIALAASETESGFSRNGAELAYTIHLADKKDMPFTGAEPRDQAIFEAFRGKAKDVAAFYILRHIPFLRDDEKYRLFPPCRARRYLCE